MIHAQADNLPLQQALAAWLPAARLSATPVPGTPIRLWLLDESMRSARLSPDQTRLLMATQSYWFLCWASGAAMARWILQKHIPVADRTVLDFGCGSGVVAVAAALAGARRVLACDSDATACEAARANAALNGVKVECLPADEALHQADTVLLADVLYDRDNLPLLQALRARVSDVWVAESRLASLPEPYRQCAEIEGHTVPDLGGFDEFQRVRLFRPG